MRTIFVFLCLVILRTIDAATDLFYSNVEKDCVEHCSDQNTTDLKHYDSSTCDDQCIVEQCTKGCKLWEKALTSSCHEICYGFTNRVKAKDVYCAEGCKNAIAAYFSLLTVRLGTPPPPALVADSLNATSLKLEWNFPAGRRKGLTCYIQWQYKERQKSWQNYPNVTWNPEGTIATIDNLKPYTKYRFRVALIPTQRGEPILSSSSVVIITLPYGAPESSPVIVRHSAVDFTRISVRWEPGPFPHGPLLSYVLKITDNNPQVHTEVKEVPPEKHSYVFHGLASSTDYNVTVQMRNSAGIGPPATVKISTPPASSVRGSTKPILIVASEHSVIEQGAYILDVPVTLYETEKSIRGLAVHIAKKMLFISESDGHVVKMSLETKKTSRILTSDRINFKPLHLSVDWLNGQLYVLGEVGNENKRWQIARCNLDGSGLTVAIAGLTTKPHCVEVDPYNGYLFWAVPGNISESGLYRLDLADISNGIRHEVRPKVILKIPNLGAFTLDHTNFSLLVSTQSESTIYSVSLDGNVTYNVRTNVTKSKMHKVVSLATANKIFYWTDGDSVFYEEHKNVYFHNSYPDLAARTYHKIVVNLESSQPIPFPVNPPRSLQALFGRDSSKLSWKAPHLLDGQGRGAWQNWSYVVSLKNTASNEVVTVKDIDTISSTVHNLTQNSRYIVRAAAYSSYGTGPWSREFVGSTLLNKKQKPYILWATDRGLSMSDTTGQNVRSVIGGGGMTNFYVTDITWFREQIYLVTNNSQMLWYNTSSHKYGKLLDSVGSIGIDWIGKKLYWSNIKQQMMIRGNLDGSQQEPLSIVAVAKELEIDSVKAYIYWSTGYAVECAHLNGADKIEYRRAEYFSGNKVMGLSLDMDHKNIYWIVRSSERSTLFKAPMAGYGLTNGQHVAVERVANLGNPVEGPLSYFHNRLLWLQDNETAAISDLQGQNIAVIKEAALSRPRTVYVVDPTLHKLPESGAKGFDNLVVIPNMVNRSSVKVVGSSESFNVSWDPVDNVNYGTVFYEVQIDPLSRNDSIVITTYPSIKYWQIVTPYTRLHVSIRAFTYWGASPELKVKIQSPPSRPSAPRNVRSYVGYKETTSDDVTITFRWDAPLSPNGVIQGYKVYCWYYRGDARIDLCDKVIKSPEVMEHTVHEQSNKNRLYYFEVRAFTKIGDGKMSEALLVNSEDEFPLPTLLIASKDSIFLQDIDANRNFSIIHGINSPTELGFLIKENKIFWLNEMKELLMFSIKDSNKTKLLDVAGDAVGLTVDWLERSIYYVEKFDKYSIVHKVDLNLYEKGQGKSVEILRRPRGILKLEISPFTKKLYWTEVVDGSCRLMESGTDGKNVLRFFSKYYRNKRYLQENIRESSCDCPLNLMLGSSFSVDHSVTKSKPVLTLIDHDTNNIISSDKDGCRCEIIANYTTVGNYLPVKKIRSDFGSLYWTNPSRGNLYVLKRQKRPSVLSREVRAQDISIFGRHIQPYPTQQCLVPVQNQDVRVKLRHKSSSSFHLVLPEYQVHENCSGSSMATVQYTVCYNELNGSCEGCEGDCRKLTSFDKEVEIKHLKPYMKYKIWVSYGNHFTKVKDKSVGPAVILQTAPGAPSKPLNVTATVLNPTLAEVTWRPPSELNGELVYYEIHWQTERTRSGVRKKEEQPVSEHQTTDGTQRILKAFLHKLSPNETYTVWVRAYCETNESSSDSETVKIVTYPEPSVITPLNITSQSMYLSWDVSSHVEQANFQYSSIMSSDWMNVTQLERTNDVMYFSVEGLSPKSIYKFRLCLIYEKYPKEFYWPLDSKFTLETLGDRPSPPGIPLIQYLNPNEYTVWWEASKDNGAPIELYRLEGLLLKHYRTRRNANRSAFFYTAPSIIEEEPEWKTFYNGTKTSWIINGLSEKYKYVFRVFALNSFGWSDASQESIEFDLNETARLADKQSAMTVVIIATGITIGIICILVIVLVSLACSGKKKEPQIIHIPTTPDVELATLRELPRRGVHNTNVLYVSTLPTTEEIKLLPHIKREQIILTKFLGSGAFGEVFEGKAKEIPGHTKVAIKTLRKGASDQEKAEFLQEAQLMSHFKHEHILQLLGVCLDNDPHFIIMELMEGGDLLTYLRSSRNPVANTPMLTLIELLKMCVDVSKGCRYLEEMHFVHRDLACRNCLVSSTDTDNRIVKIGDFGLARDIYKNDYYRKEGEGLLPVRWMAPESLVDGVFTSQSDVWAFGILLWEIMTLGQQPYPARNNLEVLHYVKGGGRLGKPMDCPVELHSLMLECWQFIADARPTFKYCLDVLENLHQQKLRNPTTCAHEGQYISTVPECVHGVSNEAYFQDINHNSQDNSWKSDNEEDKEKTPFLSDASNQEGMPKYLELLCDPNSSLENEGYEIPNQIVNTPVETIKPTKTFDSSSRRSSTRKC